MLGRARHATSVVVERSETTAEVVFFPLFLRVLCVLCGEGFCFRFPASLQSAQILVKPPYDHNSR